MSIFDTHCQTQLTMVGPQREGRLRMREVTDSVEREIQAEEARELNSVRIATVAEARKHERQRRAVQIGRNGLFSREEEKKTGMYRPVHSLDNCVLDVDVSRRTWSK